MMDGGKIDAKGILADDASSLSKTIAAIGEMESTGGLPHQASVGISSNATLNLLGVFLRKHAVLNGVRLAVHQGNHDDAVGDVERFVTAGIEHLVLWPVLDNLMPSFEAQLGDLSENAVAEKERELRGRYRLVFERAKTMRGVIVCTFHRLSRSDGSPRDRIGSVVESFNNALRAEAAAYPNVRVVDTGLLLSEIGLGNAIDLRYYFRGKAPYTTQALNLVARRITAVWRGFGTYFYKVLALDCDNTLWGGIIGEDLLQGIGLDPFDYPGNVFWRVQNELVTLERSGILLCLCTKNNPADVDEVFANHPATVLRDGHFALKKVNWEEKTTNLRQISAELGVGLDSIVFLDDSPFECEGIRKLLPMVRTFQVPSTLSDYPRMITEIRELFLAGGISEESRGKTEQYRQRAAVAEAEAAFQSKEEFLASLGLRVEVSSDDRASAPRISELTMKSNQFNLTTRRYGVGEVMQLMEAPGSTVYSMVVSDKFGSAGLTGVLIMRWEGQRAVVDSFLMSCRVIGRGIEFAIWDAVKRHALQRGCSTLAAEYLPTAKNSQVADFFDRMSVPCVAAENGARRYETAIEEFSPPRAAWVEVVGGN